MSVTERYETYHRLIHVEERSDGEFSIIVSTNVDPAAGPEIVGVVAAPQDVPQVVERHMPSHLRTLVELELGRGRFETFTAARTFATAFRRHREGGWQTQHEFYADAGVTSGRFGVEIDFGCFWRVDSDADDTIRARVSWIERSGEVYAYVNRHPENGKVGAWCRLLGRTRPNDRELIDRALAGWTDACLDAKRLSWITRSLGVMARSYADATSAAKAYGTKLGFAGNHGGWIYDSDGARIGHGWGTLARVLTDTRGLLFDERTGRYRIVDARSTRQQYDRNQEV